MQAATHASATDVRRNTPVRERAISSAVRALASHARGQRFKSFIAHHFQLSLPASLDTLRKTRASFAQKAIIRMPAQTLCRECKLKLGRLLAKTLRGFLLQIPLFSRLPARSRGPAALRMAGATYLCLKMATRPIRAEPRHCPKMRRGLHPPQFGTFASTCEKQAPALSVAVQLCG